MNELAQTEWPAPIVSASTKCEEVSSLRANESMGKIVAAISQYF